jgi:hypothetical protein
VARFAGGSSSPPEAQYCFASLAQRPCEPNRRLGGVIGVAPLMILVFSPGLRARRRRRCRLGRKILSGLL